MLYEWNFGDGYVSDKKDTEHIFKYPGTYVVTLYAGFKRQEQVARHEITILPVEVSLTKNQAGDVQINNDSPYEIDISGYKLQAIDSFVFPARSIILPNQTITISQNRLGRSISDSIVLYGNEGTVVASISRNSYETGSTVTQSGMDYQASVTPQIRATSDFQQSFVNQDQLFGFADESKVLDQGVAFDTSVVSSVEEGEQLASLINSQPRETKNWPYLALFGVLLVGVLSVYAKPTVTGKDDL